MSSDDLQIDPDLDKEDERDVLIAGPQPPRKFTNFFTTSTAAASASAAQNAPFTKKKATRRPKVAATDTKQTRLGAGLKPIRLQLDPEDTDASTDAVGHDATIPMETAISTKPKRVRKRKDDEDLETMEMAKLAKGNVASKKTAPPKGNRRKGKVETEVEMETEVELNSEIETKGKGSVRPDRRNGAKRKSTAGHPPDGISSNSIENAIHIPDSPDQATSSKTSTIKRRKIAQTEDSRAVAIDVDTSFEQDDGIEVVEVLRSSGSAGNTTSRSLPGKTAHPFFGGNPRLAKGNSVEPSSNRDPVGLNGVNSIAMLPTTPKLDSKKATDGSSNPHAFFQLKGGNNLRSTATTGGPGTVSFPSGASTLPVGKAGWGKGETDGGFRAARFPGAEEQHVQPYPAQETPVTARANALPNLPKRSRTRSQTRICDDSDFWRRIYPKETEVAFTGPEKADNNPRSTAPSISIQDTFWTETPAVRALQSKADDLQTSGTRLWIDKYKPLTAAEVLDNRIPAEYLVSWLKELALGQEAKHAPGGSERPNPDLTPKKRKILTKVKRARKKKDKEDDWIVDDTLDPIDDYLSADGTDTTGSLTDDEHPNGIDIVQGISVYPSFQSRLANSILLQGPHGCGKTAAVHAAAAELGWEVFEVNPGSRRSGAQLSAMVGEVGKNHMVGRSGHAGQESVLTDKSQTESRGSLNPSKRNTLAAAFDRANGPGPSTKMDLPTALGSAALINPFLSNEHQPPVATPAIKSVEREQIADVGNFGFIANTHGKGTQGKDIRQSLILFEEVDILYEEDQGFWPQVIDFIATSKRPVVMTCNDLGLIPFERLPLQCTLLFSPPDPLSLGPYLRNIARLERAPAVTETYISALMSAVSFNHPSGLVLQQPLAPVSLRQARGIDMRMAIMQLQLDVGCFKKTTAETLRVIPRQSESLEVDQARLKWKRSSLMAEARSYADAYLDMGLDMLADIVDVDRFRPSADDEEGLVLVQKSPLSAHVPVLSGSNCTGDIAQTFWTMAGNITSIQEEEQDVVFNLASKREAYQLSTLPFLDPIIPLEAHLLPSPVLFTSYIPAISTMVDIDDRLEREDAVDAAQGRPRKNRKSGRMMRLTANAASAPSYVRQLAASDDIGEVGLKAVRDSRLDFSVFSDSGSSENQIEAQPQ